MKTLLVSGNWTVVPFLKALSESYALVVLYDANMPAIQAQGVQNAVPLASFAQPGMADYAWDVAAHIVNGLDVDEMFGRLPVPPDNYLLGWAIRQWAQHVLWIEQLKQVLLQRGEIAGLVVHEDVTQYMKVAVQWCKAHGIQSMQVAHGNYGCETQAIGNGIHEVLNTDYVAAGNWRQGAFFEHICGDASRVRVTGFPQWDLWAKLVPDQEMARGLLHMPMDRPVIGYLTSWAEGARKDALTEQFAATFKALCDVVKKRNYGLVVKVHPAAEQNNMLPKSWYVEQAKQEGIHCTITHEYNDAVLQAIDLAFSCWPTCMMS
ncbi:MAG: CDP-glycerol glycerophosphotransferase family protein, partial [Gammaproteobacteria bacterium]|nr:CDP-glycerol glycerophosphotransferase family protein [Gammaproteobacteria bacterium]